MREGELFVQDERELPIVPGLGGEGIPYQSPYHYHHCIAGWEILGARKRIREKEDPSTTHLPLNHSTQQCQAIRIYMYILGTSLL